MSDQILRGVSAVLSWQNVDYLGEPAAPAGAVTVTVTRADGTAVVTAQATSGSGSDPRTYTLSASDNSLLDRLTVVWTDAGDSSTHTTYVDVVGGYYFTIAEARASDRTLEDQDKYPAALVQAKRREVEEEFERITQRAFVPRFHVYTPSGTGTVRLKHPDVIDVRFVHAYSDADTYTEWTADDLGVFARTGQFYYGGQHGDLRIGYTHGLSEPPEEVKQAALQRLRSRLNFALTGIPDRATSFTVDGGGTYRLDTAGPDKTGMPEVDAVLSRWSMGVKAA